MKAKIKVLSLLLAVAMTASVFVACAKDDSKTPGGGDSGTSTTSQAPIPPSEREPVKLKWYHWGESPKKPDAVVKALNAKSMADIKTEIDFIFANDQEAVQMMCATGGEYDMVFTCEWYNNFASAAASKQFADITDAVKTVTPDLYEFMPETVWAGATVNNKIYAVPTYKDVAAESQWMVNKPYVIDGAGAEAEFKATNEKIQSVTPLLEKVKAYADAGNPYPSGITAPFNINQDGVIGVDTGWDKLASNVWTGIRIDVDTTVMSYLEDEEYIERFKTIKDWNTRGLINRDASEIKAESPFLCVGYVQAWDGAESGLNTKYSTEVVFNTKYGPVYTTSFIQGSMQAISPNSKNIDRSLQYIEYMNLNAEYRNMLAYGIEGATWEKTPEGTAKRLNEDWMPGAFSQATFFTMLPEYPAPANSFSNLLTSMDTAHASPLVGFVPNLEPIKTEIAAGAAIINAVGKEFLNGSVKDVDAKVKETLDKLYGVGYDAVKKELQAQVDAFIAAK